MNIGAPSAPKITLGSSKLIIRIPPLKGRYIPEVCINCISTPVPRGLKAVHFPCTPSPPATHIKHRVTSLSSHSDYPPSDTTEIGYDESDLSELSADEVADELPSRTAILRSHNQPHHRYTSSTSISTALSPGPLLAPPSTRSIRPRSGSFDEPSYLIVQPQFPSKRPRRERDEYDHRPRLSATSMSRGLLLDAATDEGSVLNAREQQPQSPRAVLVAHQSRNIPVDPLDRPGELRPYQTNTTLPPRLRSLLYKPQTTTTIDEDDRVSLLCTTSKSFSPLRPQHRTKRRR
ncbi:hypothetical protein F4604DRAFT_447613 [Suillus subluteus]|nr:hypothetical protein F4604DRAFT_447613 [Suillus subluteus]